MGKIKIFVVLSFLLLLAACSPDAGDEAAQAEKSSEEKKDEVALTGKLALDNTAGKIGDQVTLSATDLKADEALKVVWVDMVGSYALEENYSFIGTTYEPTDKELLTDTADAEGNWQGTITIPKGFGDDHDILIYQNDQVVAKANYFVETVFTMEPESGPVGSEVTITGEGLSWKMYGSLWHLNYDNKYTGMITGVSTEGEATAVIRAAGSPGDHTIMIESGSSGLPFLNRSDSSINYIHNQKFTFHVTDEEPEVPMTYVEEAPEPADGGIQLPDVIVKDGVTITSDKDSGIVGEEVVLKGSGLPANETVTVDWHTMVGDRVSSEGYEEKVLPLGDGKVKTNDQGEFSYPFAVPEDLGGLPHLIDVKVGDEIYGQTYFRILPSIVSVSPASGPVGTEFTLKIQGSGWTEFDNAMALTYDNANNGYMCAFHSQGTLELKIIASGNVGYHVVDIYPSIYKGQQVQPDLYLRPQLTYRTDHPGTGIPALRALFEVTEN